jgi:homoserine O-succinyltransferase
MDGIDRRKSDEKNFGVFECLHETEHPLTQGLATRFHVPHSRWNGVERQDLVERGYSVLSRIAGDGVDTFIKQEQSLFVFFQGHLEYETDTLMREYRRDVSRYIKRELPVYPLLPRSYFDEGTERALTELGERAVVSRRVEIVKQVAAAMGQTTINNTWQESATQIYANWLQLIQARKGAAEWAVDPKYATSM